MREREGGRRRDCLIADPESRRAVSHRGAELGAQLTATRATASAIVEERLLPKIGDTERWEAAVR